MNKIFLTLMTSFAILTGCTLQNAALDVDTLSADVFPKQQLVKTGLSTSLAPAMVFERFAKTEGDRSFHSDIVFYETVLSYGPLTDPRAIFLLTNAYIVTNQQSYGIAFLERLLKRYDNSLTTDMKASYLSAYALLRATYADQVTLPARIWEATLSYLSSI